jgi:two-component system probable response regulator PhcQ
MITPPMDNYYDHRKFAILYVDDEEKSLKNFTRAFGESFRILTATNAQDGLALLEKHQQEIGVLMTDQRMPGEKGVWLLERARQLQPRIIRILVTAFTDMDAAIAAVNTGSIYKFIMKPWDPPQLDNNLRRALEFFMVQRERDQLLKEKLSVIHNMMIADRIVSLGLLAQGLSHHIRNPLQAVKTFLDLAPSKLDDEKTSPGGLRDPDFWREYYKNTQTQLDKVTNLLKDLWTAQERPDASFGDRLRVHEAVAEQITRLKPQLDAKGIAVRSEIPADLPEIGADGLKIHRLFELLLRDEMASLPPNSEVTLTGRFVAETSSGRPEVQISLHDNGPGLPKEALRLLFDPFVVRMDIPSEYGINLMACFFIVHHHGGRIEAKSEEGKGTTFVIHLPQSPSQSPTEDRPEFLQKILLNETLWEKLISTPD